MAAASLLPADVLRKTFPLRRGETDPESGH
jgi:hypothetical protein